MNATHYSLSHGTLPTMHSYLIPITNKPTGIYTTTGTLIRITNIYVIIYIRRTT